MNASSEILASALATCSTRISDRDNSGACERLETRTEGRFRGEGSERFQKGQVCVHDGAAVAGD